MPLLHRPEPTAESICFSGVIEIAAVVKARPRIGKGRAYTPKATADYEEKLGWLLKAAGARPVEGPVGVILEIAGAKGRGDIDNYSKSFLDGAQGSLWGNDSQVRQCVTTMLDGEPGPFIRIVVFTL